MKKNLTSFILNSLLFLSLLTAAASLNLEGNFTLKGSVAGGQFGSSVSSKGDIDNDGYDDIIIGTSGLNVVYVVYGGLSTSTDGINLSSTSLNPSTTGFTITGNGASDLSSPSVNIVGDINNDGYNDIVLGSSPTGVAYVIYGGPRSMMSNIDLSMTTLDPLSTGFMIKGKTFLFGYSVSTGNVNNDDYDDIIVGSPFESDVRGSVYVIYGGLKSNMQNIDLSLISELPSTMGFSILGESQNDFFGLTVTAGDVNADGYDDIIAGAAYKDSNTGAVYVIYGGNNLTNLDLSSPLSSTQGFKISGESYSNTGKSLSTADIDNDGFADIIIGAEERVFVVYGQSSQTDISLSSQALNPATTGFKLQGGAANDLFGIAVGSAGDLKNDGYEGIIVGALGRNNGEGAAYVIYGGPRSNLTNIDFSTSVSPSQAFQVTVSSSVAFGVSVCSGDVDNDGMPELIIGATGENDYRGTVYVLLYDKPQCPANCNGCSGSSVCIDCASPYLLYQGQCVLNCPVNTTLSNGTCVDDIDCPSNCQVCSDSSSCQVCSSPYFLYQGQCISDCPPTTFGANGICQNCPINCDTCSDSSSCQVCSDPLLVYQGQCVSNCPARTVAVNGTCENCPDYCEVCSSPTSCQVCASPYSWN